MKIAVIVGTSREGRVTPRLAHWVMKAAEQRTEAEFKLVDLKDFDIPMLEQAPWLPDRQMTDGTKRWLDELAAADGLIIVTGEYNHTIPAVLKNALDQTNGQIVRKPVAIVSHGVNSGVRANEHLRQIFNSKMDAFTISATVTFFGNLSELLDENGEAKADNGLNDSKLDAMLGDIIWYTKAIKDAKDRDE